MIDLMASRWLLIIYAVFCFEIGTALIVLPWLDLWKQNFVLYQFPFLRLFFLNDFFRGAVSGLGLANIILGVSELVGILRQGKRS